MMDDLSDINDTQKLIQYKICNISNRCIFTKYNRYKKKHILCYKTLTSWQYL